MGFGIFYFLDRNRKRPSSFQLSRKGTLALGDLLPVLRLWRGLKIGKVEVSLMGANLRRRARAQFQSLINIDMQMPFKVGSQNRRHDLSTQSIADSFT